jgi:hypothetical protein
MSLSTLRDSTVILTDHSNFVSWLKQIEARSQSLEIWNLINPTSTTLPIIKPRVPPSPGIGNYQPNAVFATANPDQPPALPSQLSTAGAKAYKDDIDFYKNQLDTYKLLDREYREEKANLDKLVALIQSTTSVYLQTNCCTPGQSIRQWIANLTETVGVDPLYEQRRTRTRYQESLKPMRAAGSWAPWLAEYDHAATEAAYNGAPELLTQDSVKQDFMKAVSNVAPMWVTTFQQFGSKDQAIQRKEMVKLFREHMVLQHPIKGKQKGAFAAAGPSLAGSGESTQAADGDAHPADEVASLKRGRSRANKAGPKAISKQSVRITNDEPTAVGGQVGSNLKCPACEQRHSLKDCFYAFPEKQPDWFQPKPTVIALMKFRMENDPVLIESLRSVKRPRTQTPRIKQSHTPTPTRITEADDE